MADAAPDLRKARSQRLHASAQALLYDIAKRVRAGYHWWFTGEVPAEKTLAVVAKFIHQFDTDLTTAQRHQRKKDGDLSATLFVWPLRHDPAGYATRFGFLVLATEHIDGEVMYDARRRPVRCSLYADGNAVFHLMPTQVTVEKKIKKPGPKKKKSTKSEESEVVTKTALAYQFDWRLSAKSLDLMRARFAASVNAPSQIFAMRTAYQALPMTSGYRTQFKEVLAETKVRWKKATTPAVLEVKKSIKEGSRADPFAISTLPYIRGFPRLYDDPPMTLGAYLDTNQKVQKEVAKVRLEQVRADHTEQEFRL